MKAGKSARKQANALLPVASRSPEQWGKKTTGSKPILLSPDDRLLSKNARRKLARYGEQTVNVGQVVGTGLARKVCRERYSERLSVAIPQGQPSGYNAATAAAAREKARLALWLKERDIFNVL